tara:strand:+ start:590 stop:787 length:198 start_codon:yes stop_codon:yes gene_type:complete
MNKFKINCPSCGKRFPAENDMRNYLKVREALFKDEIKVKEKLLNSKYKLELKKVSLKLNKKLEEI